MSQRSTLPGQGMLNVVEEGEPLTGRASLVLVTGAPGSGKSTLGTALSDALRVPFLARDAVRGGLFFTAGSWREQPRSVPPSEHAVEAFLRMVETTTGLGVSCIVEYLVRRERPGDLRRLTAAADCSVLHTWCSDPMGRFVRRTEQDQLLNRRPVLTALGYETIGEHTADSVARMETVTEEMQTEFELPTMAVNTDNGFEPTLERIIDFVVGG